MRSRFPSSQPLLPLFVFFQETSEEVYHQNNFREIISEEKHRKKTDFNLKQALVFYYAEKENNWIIPIHHIPIEMQTHGGLRNAEPTNSHSVLTFHSTFPMLNNVCCGYDYPEWGFIKTIPNIVFIRLITIYSNFINTAKFSIT